MPKISIDCSIDLEDQEVEQLASILCCSPSDLKTRLSPYTDASIEEYIRMMLGQKVFTRGSDFREYRLFLMMKHAFGSTIPNEVVVSSHFQLTPSQARSSIRNVLSKYKYLLHLLMMNTIWDLLTSGKQIVQDHTIITNNLTLIDEMNQTLGEIDGSLQSISKDSGTISTYRVQPRTWFNLIKYYMPLASKIMDTIWNLLKNAKKSGRSRTVTSNDPTIIDTMNKYLRLIDLSLTKISLSPGQTSTYKIESSSYDTLSKLFTP
jgi:hypothetical protein